MFNEVPSTTRRNPTLTALEGVSTNEVSCWIPSSVSVSPIVPVHGQALTINGNRDKGDWRQTHDTPHEPFFLSVLHVVRSIIKLSKYGHGELNDGIERILGT